MGIEPTCPAWKAGALPLSYTRLMFRLNTSNLQSLKHMNSIHSYLSNKQPHLIRHGGGGRIRTYVDVRRQIYSLLPLTTRPPLRLKPQTPKQDRALWELTPRCQLPYPDPNPNRPTNMLNGGKLFQIICLLR